MDSSNKTGRNHLVERMVRNEEIFCSLLFDQINKTLRVVDFRGGNFQGKHNYLERVLVAEGMRKIFTLIERDDMNGWQRVGYHREGSIPGYYKRSDAYIMSRIYDADYNSQTDLGEEDPENKEFLNELRTMGKNLAGQKMPNIRVDQVTDAEVEAIVAEEQGQRDDKSTGDRKAKSSSKKKALPYITTDLADGPPVFPQFSREVEFFNFVVRNRRTKQLNVVGAEYQDCFGNAKVQLIFTPESKAEQNLARAGLEASIERLIQLGAVSIFALARVDDPITNAIYVSTGFRNTGWMSRQLFTEDGPVDQILWTRKLI